MDFQWPWTADFGRRVGGTGTGGKYFYYYSTADWGCASYAAEKGRAGGDCESNFIHGNIPPPPARKSVFMWESAEGEREKSSMRVMGDG